MTPVVCLIYGFCAALAYGGEPTIDFGYMSQDDFVPVLELTGDNPTEGKTLPSDDGGHTLTWQFLDGGAEVGIDGHKFVIMHFTAA
jgi:hypothetical protein